ncbi:unnamed protein product, partial [marine sediment metagenome]
YCDYPIIKSIEKYNKKEKFIYDLSVEGENFFAGNAPLLIHNTFISTANAIVICGAKPVFVDIKDNLLIDEDLIEKSITKKTKAIIPVHLFGKICNMDKIMEIAKKHNLKVVEDSAQCIKPGIIQGDIACFSFYRTKNFSCFEGGAVTTNDSNLLKRMRLYSDQGQESKHHHTVIGYNYRMSDLNAVMINHQIKYHFIGGDSELGRFGTKDGHYPIPVYEQPIYKKLGITGNCPNTERICKDIKK